MKNVKIYKNKSGISMLALVVTIIILLILAGITILVLTGDNGIISKTEEARDITDFGKVKEEILKKWLEVEHGNINNNISNQGVADALQTKLQSDDKDAKAIYRNENETIEVGYKGYEVEITTDGEITTARKDAKTQIKEAWEKVTADTSLTTNQSKIDKLADELEIDTSKITIDQDGNVKIDGYNDYTETITTDEQGNVDVTIKEDEKPTYVDRASVSISANPESQTVFEGTDVNFTVTATGTGNITYKWYEVTPNTGIGGKEIDLNKKDDKIEGTDKSKYIISEDGKTLTVRNTGEDDEKYYYCEVTATYTNPKNNKTTTDKKKSDTAKLTVATGIQVAKDKIVVDEGETIELKILADDDGQTTYQWYKKAPEGSTQDQKIDGATSPTYEKTNSKIEDEGEYYCEVTQTIDEETKTIQSKPIEAYVKVPIKITSEPTDTKAIEGQNASLNVEADGGGIITYQWYKTLPNANTGGTPIPGATDKTYNIPETTIYDDSYYYCEIKQTFPVDNSEKTVKTSPAKITIIERVTIKTQPISQNILEETPASFTISVNGNGEITYQWYKAPNSTATGTAITGATSNTYSIDKTTTGDSGYYYCKVTQTYGEQTQTVDSNRAQLTVVSKVAINEQPKSVNTIAKKENVTFSITTSGQGTIAYQWYYGTNSQEPGTAIEGANQNTYTIPQANVTTELNGGYYYCVVTQTYNGRTVTETSSKALLTVVAPVSIAANPTDVTVINESTATFKVEAVGISVPDLTYQWYKADDATATGTPISGANQSTYTTPPTTAEDDGKYYYCIVTQKYGDATSTVTTERALLTVGQAGSIGNPSNTSAIEYKNSVSFTAVATGSGEITYQWYKNTTQAVSGASLIEGATSSTYTIPAEEVKTSINNTYYYCIATQKYGDSTKQITSGIAKLTVVAQTKITEEPANDYVIAGVKDAAFAVQVEGQSNPTFTYQWYKNTTGSNTEGTAITGATSNTYSISKSDITTSMNGTYYYCVITQKYGTSTHETNTTAAKLTVVAPAEVTKNPTAVSVIAGITDVSFSANGSGSGAISFQWYYATSATGGTSNKVEGATSSTYSIPAANVTTSHNGRYYYAEITQTYNGQTYTLPTNRALLTAVEPVKFTTQPNNATLTAGHSASFSSLAIGTSIPDITYQWYKADSITGEGEAISGATSSSYTTPRLTEQDDGKYYYVVATQKYGTPNEGTTTAISNRALLTIGEAGTITNPIDVSAVEKNNQVSFTVTKSGAGTFTYQWYKTDQAGAENPTEDASKAISGATSATYTIPASDVTTDLNNTYYYCVAKQTYGSSSETIISTAAKLSVVEQVTIESQPTNVSTIEGKTATYTVEATGEGTKTYQWYSSTTNSNTGGTPINGATDPTYTTPTLTTSNDDTYYYCVVTQTYGTSTHTEATTPAKLTVTEATQITTQPTAQQKLEGNTATFTVEASGEGTKTYQWYRASTPTGGTPELIEGATSSTYTTPETNINNDNGKYYFCIVTQSYGEPEVQSTAISDRALLTVKARSKITTEPQAQSKIAGNKATFTVTVDGEGTKSYQWYVANDETSEGTPVSGATGASYTTPATTVEGDNGKYYYVVVTQTYNGQTHTVTSGRALLTVVDRLAIKTPPTSQSKLVDNTATFNVVTTGGGTITYQWYVSNTNSNTSGTALNNGVGAKTDTYTTDQLTTSDNNKWYYVVVTQDYEGQQVELRSSTAKLEVVARTEITTQPKSVSVIANENDVTFTAAANGSGTITYQWYVADTSTAAGTAISGATSETYTIDKADVTTDLNGKYYYCIATQTYNGQQATATTNKALLTVVSKATIGTQPSNATVTVGNTATFTTSANGTSLPDFTYQWYVADSATAAGTAISGANTAQYTIPATTTADNGKYYYCVVTQKYGISETTITTTRAKLTVGESGSLSSPSDVDAIAGKNNVTFTVTPSGANTESFTYQWYKSNTNNPVEDASKAISGATSASYTIPAANVTTAIDNTYYYCIAKQTYGSSTNTIISTSAHLEVIPEFNLTSTQPRDVTVISEITDANFSVEVDTTAMNNAAGGKGTIAYQWYSNTANSTSGATKITTGGTAGSYTSPRSSNTATGSDVNRYYYCVVTQKFGVSTVTKTSRIAKLTITPAVTITNPTSLGKIVGDTAQFSVTATGTVNSGQELTYQWYKADSETGTGTAIPTTTGTGSQTPTYTTPATDIANYNNKWYYCIVTQKYGDPNEGVTTATSSRAKLSVVAVGGITAQPQSVSVVQGNQDVTFSVAATGQSNLTYQWYKNITNSNSGGTAISGATSATYTIAKASATTAITNTFYYCVVKQAYEQSEGRTFTSNPAQLTVGAANYTTGNVYYDKLADAINAAANNGTVTQLLDITGDNSDDSNVQVTGKTVTFNNNGKTLNKTAYGITVNSGANLTISGSGTILTSTVNRLISNYGTLYLTHSGILQQASTLNAYRAIWNEGTLNKTGNGTIKSSGIYSTIGGGGTINVSNGTIEASENYNVAIHSHKAGAVVIISDNAKIERIMIGASDGLVTLNVTGGTIESLESSGISIYDNAVANITGGTITGATNGIDLSSGTVNVGSTSSTFNRDNPVIQGEQYGINKTGGTWNFYNGILKGKTAGYTGGEPSAVRSGYWVTNDNMDGNYHTSVLKLIPTLTLNKTTLGLVYAGSNGTITITYNGDGALSATSSDTGIATTSVSGNTITVSPVTAGTATITVSAAEGSDYLATESKTCTVTVNKATTSITATEPGDIVKGNQATFTASANPHITGKWEITTSTNAVTIDAGNTTTDATSTTIQYTGNNVATSPTTIKIKFIPTDSNYEEAEKTLTQTVLPAYYKVGNTYYNTLESAYNAVPENGTITLEQDIMDETANITITKNITIDLQNHTLNKTTEPIKVGQNGTLTITGTKTGTGAEQKIGTLETPLGSPISITGGTVNIGLNSGDRDAECPLVKGEQYAISQTSGNWNFYNGMLKGKTEAYDSNPANVRTGCGIGTITTDASGYKTAILKITPTFSIDKTAMTLSYDGDAGTITITYNGDGQITATSDHPEIASVSLNNKTITVTPVKASTTKAIITVSANEGTNYLATSNATCEVTVKQAIIDYTSANYTGTYDGQPHTFDLTVNKPAGGYKIYYSKSAVLDASNYDTLGDEQKPTRTLAGEDTVHWCIVESANNYKVVTGNNKITINRKDITANTMTIATGPTSDLNSWKINNNSYRSRFDITYNQGTQINNINFTGGSGYEKFYLPIITTVGETYTFSCDYKNITGFTARPADGNEGMGLYAVPGSKVVTKDNAISTTVLPKEQSSTLTNHSLTFTATEPITNITFDFGWIADNIQTQLAFGNFTLTNNWSYIYDGNAKEITTVVKDTTRNVTLAKGTDYDVTYANNTNVGTATATIEGELNYTGTSIENFTIANKPETPITYDYAVNQEFTAGTYQDTGYVINWDKDFTIEETVNVSELGKRYVLFSGVFDGARKELAVEIQNNNKLRLIIGNSNIYERLDGVIAANEDIKVTFTWTASTKTYTATAIGENSSATISNTYNIDDSATRSLKIGSADFRTGSNSPFSPIIVKSFKVTRSQEYNEAVYLPTVSQEGYTHNGWYTAASGGTQITTGATVPANSTTYYAQYTANEYTVAFNGNGGTDGASITKPFGTALGTLPTSTRTGYDFQGWFTSADGGTQITQNTTMPLNGATYYAHWTASTYTVSFNPNSGTVSPTSKPVTYGQEYGTLPTPTRSEYTFAGWSGKNLFDQETKLMAINGATKTEDGYYAINTYQAHLSYNSGTFGAYNTFKENTQYTLTIKAHGVSEEHGGLMIGFSYVDGTGTHSVSFGGTTDETKTLTSKAGKTIKNLWLSFGYQQICYIDYIQLEEGATATEYEPYHIITSSTAVTQTENHELTAQWKDATVPTITADDITYGETLSATLEDNESGVRWWQVNKNATEPTSGWVINVDAKQSRTVTKTGLTAGTWYIWAKDQEGNVSSKQITVNKAANPITTTNPEIQYVGATVNLASYVANAQGTVTYQKVSASNEITSTSTLNTSTGALTLGSLSTANDSNQTITIRATAAGNANYEASTPKDITVTVQKYTRTLAWSDATNPLTSVTYLDTSKYSTVNVTGGTNGTTGEVTYTVTTNNASKLSINSTTGQLTPLAYSTGETVAATMARTSTVKQAEITRSIAVNRATGVLTLGQTDGTESYTGNSAYGTAQHIFKVLTNHGGNLSVSNTETASSSLSATTGTPNVTISNLATINTGTQIVVTVTSSQTDQYNEISKTYTLTIVQASGGIILSPSSVTAKTKATVNNISTYVQNSFGTLSYEIKDADNGTKNVTGGTASTVNSTTGVVTLGEMSSQNDNDVTVKVTVHDSGDSNHSPSEATFTITVEKYTRTLAIASSVPSSMAYQQTATAAVTISGSGGTAGSVSYATSNSNVISVNGTTLKAEASSGSAIITATMARTTTVKELTATTTITATKATMTPAPTVSMAGYTYGGTKSTPSVNNNIGGGTPVYYYNTTNSNSGGTAWSTVANATSLNAGDYWMYAEIPATTNYNSAKTAAVKFTIKKDTNPIAINQAVATQYVGANVNLASENPKYIKNAQGTVIYAIKQGNNEITSTSAINSSSGELTLGTLSGSNDDNQTITITVTAEGNENYNAKSIEIPITVQKYTRTLEWADTTLTSVTYLDTSKYCVANVTGGTDGANGTAGAVTYAVTTNNASKLSINSTTGQLTPLAYSEGETVTATITRTSTVKQAEITRSIAVARADVTISGVPSGEQFVGKDSTKEFTAIATCRGTWSVTSDQTNLVEVTSGGSIDDEASDTVTLTGKSASDTNTTITVAFNPANADQYNIPENKSFTVKATTCTVNPSELALTTGGNDGIVTLGGTNAGSFTIANIEQDQSSDFETSYSDDYIDAVVSGTTLTVTPKSLTTDSLLLTVKENNGGMTKTVKITIENALIYARLYDVDSANGTDGDTLVLSSGSNIPYTKGTLIKDYKGIPTIKKRQDIPWIMDNANKKIITTEIINEISPTSLYHFFEQFENMTEIVGISNLDTSNVTNMEGTFQFCKRLKSLDLTGFNTSNVTTMLYTFQGLRCRKRNTS